jgi:phage terminase small subunit
MNAPRTIQMRPKTPVPGHLQAAGRTHWEAVTSVYKLDNFELTTLEAACIQLDRAAEFRADIDKRGAMVADRFGILKANPAVDKERQALDAFRAQNRELGLSVEPPDSRPPMAKGYR